jgi:Leucine-rich repeat (LRR) protein
LQVKEKLACSPGATAAPIFNLLLHGNRFDELPTEVTSMSWLQELNLSLNHLTSLPPSIQSLTQLRLLDLCAAHPTCQILENLNVMLMAQHSF